ncbi:MAG: amidase family protein, partial [Candidatus Sulfotelmatobacter sp.]
ILVCPPAAIPAFRHGERSWTFGGKLVHDLDAWWDTEGVHLRGNPAAVVPVSRSSEGLPIGVQIVGRPWEEEQALTVAAALENQCQAWRVPPLS